MFRERLNSGDRVMGIFLSLPSPGIVELAGLAGHDYIVIDMEHGEIDFADLPNLIRTADLRDLPTIVRVPNLRRDALLKPLDLGATGLLIPQVDTEEEARAVVEHAKYGPEGNRGVALPRSSEYGRWDVPRYFSKSNQDTVLVVQCESEPSLDHLDGIASVEGLDMVFLGPFDLSQSLGIPGQVEHERIDRACERVIEATREADKAAGVFVTSDSQMEHRLEQGFQFISYAVDAIHLSQRFQELHDRFDRMIG